MELTQRDLQRLNGVKTVLVAVVKEAATRTRRPFFVNEGLRSEERQKQLWAIGRRGLGGEKPVTWTMKSPHLSGDAVDLYPCLGPGMKAIDELPLAWYDEMAAAMFEAAATLGVKIRWGADWDMDGKPRERGEHDSPHFELA